MRLFALSLALLTLTLSVASQGVRPAASQCGALTRTYKAQTTMVIMAGQGRCRYTLTLDGTKHRYWRFEASHRISINRASDGCAFWQAHHAARKPGHTVQKQLRIIKRTCTFSAGIGVMDHPTVKWQLWFYRVGGIS